MTEMQQTLSYRKRTNLANIRPIYPSPFPPIFIPMHTYHASSPYRFSMRHPWIIQNHGARRGTNSNWGKRNENDVHVTRITPSCFPFPPRWAESIRVPIRDFQSSVKVASHEPSNERGIKTGRKITQQKRTKIKHLKKCWRSYRNRIGKLNCRAGLEDSGSKKFYVHRREIN